MKTNADTKPTASGAPEAPRIGQTCEVWGQTCKVTKLYDFGTMDVVSLDGLRAYRLSGLQF